MSQLGTILRNRREELNLTQAEVSRQTNIRVNIIDALEKGKNSILPPTYLRSFSKSYWQFLKLPMEDFEKSFAESGIMPQVQEQSFIGTLINPEKEVEKEYTPPPPLKTIDAPRYSPRLVSGLISASMILILVVGLYYLFVKDIVDDTPAETGEQVEVKTETNPTSESGGELLSIFEDEPRKDSIILEVTAKNNTWFTINADGKKSEEVLLASGQSGRWTAVEYFILSISNNGGAVFKRNGQTLDNIGKEGTIIREMKITATEMRTSAMPYVDNQENSEQTKKTAEKPKAEPVKEKPKKIAESTPKAKTNVVTPAKKVASTTPKTKSALNSEASKPKKKTVAAEVPAKKKTESSIKKKPETPSKKKATAEKSKTAAKKKTTEKSKAADKKKKTTAAKAKETKKPTAKKTVPEKKKSSESNKVETPKTIPIGNPRR